MNRNPKNKECPPSKPLCDCIECTCKNCPDIMNLLSISLKDTACDKAGTQKRRIGIKKSKSELKICTDSQKNNITLPNFANENRGASDCICASVARALKFDIRSNINLGSSEHNAQCSKDIK